MAVPDLNAVKAYLTPSAVSYDDATITAALNAEKAAQAARCKVPIDTDPWPADLAEALMRRVAHNLALRALPLGVAATITDGAVATSVVAGTDGEVRRLEAPYRKVTVG